MKAAVLAVILAFGLLIGMGVVGASADSTGGVMCLDQVATAVSEHHSQSKQTCNDGMVDSTCGVHIACVAIVASHPGIAIRARTADWFAAPTVAPLWSRPAPNTPPPIALI